MRRIARIDETTWRGGTYSSDWFVQVFIAEYEAYTKRPIEDRDAYTFFCLPFLRQDKSGNNETHVLVTARIINSKNITDSFDGAKREFNSLSHCVQAIMISEHRPLGIFSADIRNFCYLQLTETFEAVLFDGCKIQNADLGIATANRADTPPSLYPRNILKTHIIRGGEVAKLLLQNYTPS